LDITQAESYQELFPCSLTFLTTVDPYLSSYTVLYVLDWSVLCAADFFTLAENFAIVIITE